MKGWPGCPPCGVDPGLGVCCKVEVLIRGGFARTPDAGRDDIAGRGTQALGVIPGLLTMFEPMGGYPEFHVPTCGDCAFNVGGEAVAEVEYP